MYPDKASEQEHKPAAQVPETKSPETPPLSPAAIAWRADDVLLKLCKDYKNACDQQAKQKEERAKLAAGTTQLFAPPKKQWVKYDFYDIGLEIIRLCTSTASAATVKASESNLAAGKSNVAPGYLASAKKLGAVLRYLKDQKIESTSLFAQHVLQPLVCDFPRYYDQVTQLVGGGLRKPQERVRVIKLGPIIRGLTGEEKVIVPDELGSLSAKDKKRAVSNYHKNLSIESCALIEKFPFASYDTKQAQEHASQLCMALLAAMKANREEMEFVIETTFASYDTKQVQDLSQISRAVEANRVEIMELWQPHCTAALALAPHLVNANIHKLQLAQEYFVVLTDYPLNRLPKKIEAHLLTEGTRVFGPCLSINEQCDLIITLLKCLADSAERALGILASQFRDEKSREILTNAVIQKYIPQKKFLERVLLGKFKGFEQRLILILNALSDAAQVEIVEAQVNAVLNMSTLDAGYKRSMRQLQYAIKNSSAAVRNKTQQFFLKLKKERQIKQDENDITKILRACRLSLLLDQPLTSAEKNLMIVNKIHPVGNKPIHYIRELINILWNERLGEKLQEILIDVVIKLKMADVKAFKYYEEFRLFQIFLDRVAWFSPQHKFKLLAELMNVLTLVSAQSEAVHQLLAEDLDMAAQDSKETEARRKTEILVKSAASLSLLRELVCELMRGLPVSSELQNQWAPIFLPAKTFFLCGMDDETVKLLCDSKTDLDKLSKRLPNDLELVEFCEIANAMKLKTLCATSNEQLDKDEKDEDEIKQTEVSKQILQAMGPRLEESIKFLPLIRRLCVHLSLENQADWTLKRTIDRALISYLTRIIKNSSGGYIEGFPFIDVAHVFHFLASAISTSTAEDEKDILTLVDNWRFMDGSYLSALQSVFRNFCGASPIPTARAFVNKVLTRAMAKEDLIVRSEILTAIAPLLSDAEREAVLCNLLTPEQLNMVYDPVSGKLTPAIQLLKPACFAVVYAFEDPELQAFFADKVDALLDHPRINTAATITLSGWQSENHEEHSRGLIKSWLPQLPSPLAWDPLESTCRHASLSIL